MQTKDFTTILKDASVGEWIALSSTEDRIVATAVELCDVIALANERGKSNPVVMKAHPGLLIPSVLLQTEVDPVRE